MKRHLLVLGFVFSGFLSFGQPAEYDPCSDPDIPQPDYCFVNDPGTSSPLDKGVPYLMAVVAVCGLRYLNKNG